VQVLACPFAYDGRVRNLVLAAKATAAHGWLNVMADALPSFERVSRSVLVTWPTGSSAHRRQRGFDPAERLARRYAKRHGLVAVDVLIRHGEAQEGRSAAERATLRFVARRPVEGASVLLIDDVVTTGASLRAAAVALREAGAVEVGAVAFARRS
jgi:predicted amidophosphoribosyltransferase